MTEILKTNLLLQPTGSDELRRLKTERFAESAAKQNLPVQKENNVEIHKRSGSRSLP